MDSLMKTGIFCKSLYDHLHKAAKAYDGWAYGLPWNLTPGITGRLTSILKDRISVSRSGKIAEHAGKTGNILGKFGKLTGKAFPTLCIFTGGMALREGIMKGDALKAAEGGVNIFSGSLSLAGPAFGLAGKTLGKVAPALGIVSGSIGVADGVIKRDAKKLLSGSLDIASAALMFAGPPGWAAAAGIQIGKLIGEHKDEIVGGLKWVGENVVNGIKTFAEGAGKGLLRVGNGIKDVFSKVAGAAGKGGAAFVDGVKNFAKGAWNALCDTGKKVGDFFGNLGKLKFW